MSTTKAKAKPTTKASTTPKAKTKTAAKSTTKTATKSTVKTAAKTTPTPAVPDAAPVTPVVVETMQPVVSHSMMRKRELVDLAVERSGVKKKFAKPVVEAVLAELGDAMAAGRELNMQPMGKIMVRRSKQTSNGRVMVAKVRQSNAVPNTPASTSSADAASGADTVNDAAE